MWDLEGTPSHSHLQLQIGLDSDPHENPSFSNVTSSPITYFDDAGLLTKGASII